MSKLVEKCIDEFFFKFFSLGHAPFCSSTNPVYFKFNVDVFYTMKGCSADWYEHLKCSWKHWHWQTTHQTSFIISVCLPGRYCFLTAHSAMCICRVEVGVIGGTRTGAVVFYCAAIKLCGSSHQSSIEKLSVWRFDLSILCNKARHKLFFTKCIEIKGLHFILQALC